MFGNAALQIGAEALIALALRVYAFQKMDIMHRTEPFFAEASKASCFAPVDGANTAKRDSAKPDGGGGAPGFEPSLAPLGSRRSH